MTLLARNQPARIAECQAALDKALCEASERYRAELEQAQRDELDLLAEKSAALDDYARQISDLEEKSRAVEALYLVRYRELRLQTVGVVNRRAQAIQAARDEVRKKFPDVIE